MFIIFETDNLGSYCNVYTHIRYTCTSCCKSIHMYNAVTVNPFTTISTVNSKKLSLHYCLLDADTYMWLYLAEDITLKIRTVVTSRKGEESDESEGLWPLWKCTWKLGAQQFPLLIKFCYVRTCVWLFFCTPAFLELLTSFCFNSTASFSTGEYYHHFTFYACNYLYSFDDICRKNRLKSS